MAVIKDGNGGTDQLGIDPVSKAAKVTLYDSLGIEISSGNASFGSAGNLGYALNSVFEFDNAGGYSSIGFGLSIPTGATITFEGTLDGINWIEITLRGITSNHYTSTITESDSFIGSISCMQKVRFRTSVAGSAIGTVIGRVSKEVSTLEGIEHGSPDDFDLEVSRSAISGMTSVNKFGKNADIDIGTEDVWGGGGTWVAPTVARLHNLTSGSVNDAAAGTGARTIRIYGLDTNYLEITEDLILNGLANVSTVLSYTFMSRIIVLTAGSGGTNAGLITATAATDATITITVQIGKAQSQLAIYQVPAGKTAYIDNYYGGISGGTALDLELFVKPFGGAFNLKNTLSLTLAGTSSDEHVFKYPLKVEEKGIIKLSGTATANNTSTTGGFDFILIDN